MSQKHTIKMSARLFPFPEALGETPFLAFPASRELPTFLDLRSVFPPSRPATAGCLFLTSQQSDTDSSASLLKTYKVK